VIIPQEKQQLIRQILTDYLSVPFTRSGDYRTAAKEHDAVPVFEGWTAITFLRTDGTFFNLDTEDHPGQITQENDEVWQLASLVYSSEKHPLFQQLLPDRPTEAESCDFCGSEGWITPRNVTNPTRIVCGRCGGVGWRQWRATS
jgi:hypothetical protein